MTFRSVVEICSAVLVSLGGGGAIVFGLSNYLGKLWAERGLEKQRQEYTKLNLEFSHQLDLASRRVQMEIDALGVLRKLKAQSEFQIMQELWERLMQFWDAMSQVADGTLYAIGDKEAWWREKRVKCEHSCEAARDLLFKKALSIPKPIADAAHKTIRRTFEELLPLLIGYLHAPTDEEEVDDHEVMTKGDLLDRFQEALLGFKENMDDLESAMRDYIAGKSSDVQP